MPVLCSDVQATIAVLRVFCGERIGHGRAHMANDLLDFFLWLGPAHCRVDFGDLRVVQHLRRGGGCSCRGCSYRGCVPDRRCGRGRLLRREQLLDTGDAASQARLRWLAAAAADTGIRLRAVGPRSVGVRLHHGSSCSSSDAAGTTIQAGRLLVTLKRTAASLWRRRSPRSRRGRLGGCLGCEDVHAGRRQRRPLRCVSPSFHTITIAAAKVEGASGGALLVW
mmetsp:Transcript_27931/g.80082  ORF Transcript_27931/g.80082 Transcript_27931/m.80082 type:complete len:223 (+) Transcript_27931:541-1209(+)